MREASPIARSGVHRRPEESLQKTERRGGLSFGEPARRRPGPTCNDRPLSTTVLFAWIVAFHPDCIAIIPMPSMLAICELSRMLPLIRNGVMALRLPDPRQTQAPVSPVISFSNLAPRSSRGARYCEQNRIRAKRTNSRGRESHGLHTVHGEAGSTRRGDVRDESSGCKRSSSRSLLEANSGSPGSLRRRH